MATENDVVLIQLEEQPMAFARIEGILPDHKPNWYHVKLLLLQVPPQLVTWILRDVYIDGAEFTMNGKRMRLEHVIVPEETQDAELQEEQDTTETPAKETDSNAKVISFTDLKKK